MNEQTKWELKVENLTACNCNWGCPCSFESPPTYGICEGVVAYRVVEGKYNGVPLDGLKWVAALTWPGPLHEKNGRGVVYLDERAQGPQREALKAIATGSAGGPMAIFMSTVTAGLEIRTAPIEFHAAGKKSWIRVPDQIDVSFGPIRNPVTGGEEFPSVLLPNGMLTEREDLFSANVFTVDTGDLCFEYPNRNASYFSHTWHGP